MTLYAFGGAGKRVIDQSRPAHSHAERGFPQANAVALAKAAEDAGMKVTAQETITPGNTDFGALMSKLKAGAPGQLLIMPGSSTADFFRDYEASGWKVPISGRFDFGVALGAVSPAFRDSGNLAELTGIAVFSPLVDKPEVRNFVTSYQAHYGLIPTQRSALSTRSARSVGPAGRYRGRLEDDEDAVAIGRDICSGRP
jgi:ABC-type branched-subunit amino acid transport system substrate-binding protein